MTDAAVKRLLVAMAANSAQIYYTQMREHRRPVTWKEAIEHVIDEMTYQRTSAGQHLPLFVDDDGVSPVTFAAVERQLFPRARDGKRPR